MNARRWNPILVAASMFLRLNVGVRAATLEVPGEYATVLEAYNAAAASGDTINIAAGTHTVNQLSLAKSLAIQGASAKTTILQAAATPHTADAGRLFYISGSRTITFRDLTMRNGSPPATSGEGNGGAIYAPRNVTIALTLERVALVDNDSKAGAPSGFIGGGAMYFGANSGSSSTLTISDSAISGNGSEGNGGGLLVENVSRYVVRNCTFSGNVASKVANFPYGGGISAATSTYASVIQNCTFVSNSVVSATTASSVGGAAIRGGGSARLTVESCVFDDNPMNANGRGTISGCTLSNSVYEGFLYTDVTDGGGNVATNNAGVNLTLADNGGPTPTHALLEGSAAIGAGSNPAGLSCDQRGSGYAREVPAGDPDCGAYEYASAKPSGTMFVIK